LSTECGTETKKYANPGHPVQRSRDNLAGGKVSGKELERIFVDLEKLPEDITDVFFVLTIRSKDVTFKDVKSAFLRLSVLNETLDRSENVWGNTQYGTTALGEINATPLKEFHLDDEMQRAHLEDSRAMVFVRAFRDENQMWQIETLGESVSIQVKNHFNLSIDAAHPAFEHFVDGVFQTKEETRSASIASQEDEDPDSDTSSDDSQSGVVGDEEEENPHIAMEKLKKDVASFYDDLAAEYFLDPKVEYFRGQKEQQQRDLEDYKSMVAKKNTLPELEKVVRIQMRLATNLSKYARIACEEKAKKLQGRIEEMKTTS
jgi:hypothetical protein